MMVREVELDKRVRITWEVTDKNTHEIFFKKRNKVIEKVTRESEDVVKRNNVPFERSGQKHGS